MNEHKKISLWYSNNFIIFVENNFSNSNVCTVQTIDDLQKALKSEDDIQIVVPNELLETTEFKTFISNFNSFPISDRHSHDRKTRNNSTSSSSKEHGSSNLKKDSSERAFDKRDTKEAIPGTKTVHSYW